MTSVGSACINILYTLIATTIIDIGCIRGAFSGFDVRNRTLSHEVIGKATAIKKQNLYKSSHNKQNFMAQRTERLTWNQTDVEAKNVRKLITEYLDKIFENVPHFIQSCIITSCDEDCWMFLANLFFDENGNFRGTFRVKSFIFHGHPASYSRNFHELVERLRSNMPETEFHFTSLLNSQLHPNTPLSQYLNPVYPIAPKWYYIPDRKSYADCIQDLETLLPYEHNLKISSNVNLFFPVINAHHDILDCRTWKVPKKFLENSDCLPVVIIVNGFKFLLLADCSIDAQENVSFYLHGPAVKRSFSCDIILLSRNSSEKDFQPSFIQSFSPKLIVCPVFALRGHPSKKLLDDLLEIPSVSESEAQHKFIYYKETVIEENNGKCQTVFHQEEVVLKKLIFSTDYPLTFMFNQRGQGYVRQFIP